MAQSLLPASNFCRTCPHLRSRASSAPCALSSQVSHPPRLEGNSESLQEMGPFWHTSSKSFSGVVCWGPKTLKARAKKCKMISQVKSSAFSWHMHADLSLSVNFLAVTSSTSMAAHSAFYSCSNLLHWHVPITCPIAVTPMEHRTSTDVWKLLKSVELLQTWTGLYGKEILPILHTRDLCCWNLCHNCGFVCFFQLSYWQVHHPDLPLSFFWRLFA